MKNYFNYQERIDLLTLEAARPAFTKIIAHDLVSTKDSRKLAEAKGLLDEAMMHIAKTLPDSACRQLLRTLDTHKFAIATPDKIKTETQPICIDTRDDLLEMCSTMICQYCEGRSNQADECPIARVQREMLIDPVNDFIERCGFKCL